MIERALQFSKMLEDANHDDDVVPVLSPGQLAERHGAHVDGIKTCGGGRTGPRRIKADHIGESAIAKVRQQAATGTTDVQDAEIR